MNDPFDLRRFIDAQDPVIAEVRAELQRGRKTSHWMWFVFPQPRGLGASAMSRRYAIASREEAAAYLAHPVLGPRLRDCTALLLGIEGRSAHDIFGSPDDMKLKSCATLFACVSPEGSVFHRLLDQYYQGRRDEKTLRLIGRDAN